MRKSLGDKPLECPAYSDTNQPCRCIAIEAKIRGGRRVIRLEDIQNMSDEAFDKFETRIRNNKMVKG